MTDNQENVNEASSSNLISSSGLNISSAKELVSKDLNSYFTHSRVEIINHLPEKVKSILELGAGSGETIKLVKAIKPEVEVVHAIELFDEAFNELKKVSQYVSNEDVENTSFFDEIEDGSKDLILCLDILEHLKDPWAVIKEISPKLSNNGRMIISIPNIRHWRFILRLLINGDFNYKEFGLLDKTHLRFFTLETAIALGEAGGLRCVYFGDTRADRFNFIKKIISKYTLSLSAKQFLLVLEKDSSEQ